MHGDCRNTKCTHFKSGATEDEEETEKRRKKGMQVNRRKKEYKKVSGRRVHCAGNLAKVLRGPLPFSDRRTTPKGYCVTHFAKCKEGYARVDAGVDD
jgi:hypothetical protein